MHPQIKKIISSIATHNGLVSVDMSASQYTPMGKLLFLIYYKTQLVDVFQGSITGYPHNGGSHTMYLSGTRGDLVAWLEIAREELLDQYGKRFNEEELRVLSEFAYIAQEVLAKKV